jgi:leucyl/phenylalanyl-tRNA--protein transferase
LKSAVSIFTLNERPVFPDPDQAEEDGLLAAGGDLSIVRLLKAYGAGIFPWYGPRSPILWWSPPERALILPGEEHLSRRTLRALGKLPFEVRRDTCFQAVISHCASVVRRGLPGTWITPAMQRAYLALHREGYAHSFEVFRGSQLVGGLYGVSLGAAFFGESMFSLEDYASRAAFKDLCRAAWEWGFHFIDGQVPNSNLEGLGARMVTREDFLKRLGKALAAKTRRGSWTQEPAPNFGLDTHGAE